MGVRICWTRCWTAVEIKRSVGNSYSLSRIRLFKKNQLILKFDSVEESTYL